MIAKKTKTIFVFGVVIVMLTIILGRWIIKNRFSQQVGETEGSVTEISSSEESKPQPNFPISLAEALQIAETSLNGKAYNIERETEDGKPVIEVGINGKEVFVDANTGEIHAIEDLRQKGDSEDIAELTEAIKLQKFAVITIQEALQAAENYAGGVAHTVKLENEDGNLVYEVVIDLQEVYVDAGNGKILFTETVQKADESDNSQPKSSIQIPE